MSTSISYKGSTIASFSNDTKTLTTQGKYLEADVIVTDTSSAPSLQNKTVTPLMTSQSVTADSGYDGLGTVTVNAVPAGTEGTPVASKGIATNNSIQVTPTVTNSMGYIQGGVTKMGLPVTVSASELVSGTKTISGSGTTDVTNYANASVAAGSASGPNLVLCSDASITAADNNQIGLTGTASVQPTVHAGWVSSGTAETATVIVAASVPTKSAATITPTTTDQTIASGTYLTGAQTIKGDANLVAGNIKKDVSLFGVTGTYEGGGGGLPVVTGSFTAGTAGTVQTINVSYTGNGYPLAIVCVVADGENAAEPYNTTTLKKNHGSCVLVKANPALTPTFRTGDSNAGTVFSHHRTSSSAQGSSGAYGVAYTSSTNPSGSTSTTSTIKVSAKNQFKIYVSSGDGVYGFYAGQKYDYWVMYSE